MRRTFTLNGERVTVEAPEVKSLLRVLREELSLTGTRAGCEEGACGACLVLLNGDAVNSCLVPFFRLEGADVETIEGLRKRREFLELEKVFTERRVFQCGFCSTGVLIASYALLRHSRHPSREAIADALSGNLCRCSAYQAIIDAVQVAARPTRGKNRGRS